MAESVEPDHVPIATYRWQFRAAADAGHPGFGFDDAAGLVRYLDALGIGDAYASPLFRAREGSTHGYDVVDHGMIEPAFGGEEGFGRLAAELVSRGMGLLLDMVPNHMGIDDPRNRWWLDVLRHGEGSRYAGFFDIDWDPPAEANRHKVLMPVLGDYFGRILERQELRLVYDAGRFFVTYYKRRFPVAPATLPPILRLVLGKLGEAAGDAADDEARMELESLAAGLDRLPPPSDRSRERMRERYRESEVASRRLRELVASSPAVKAALDAAVAEYNGNMDDPRSFDLLEALLDAQSYRLAYWRVAGDEINYRRFFDINELAAIRVEEPAVFEAVHALTFKLLARGWVTGLRIDHPDGLFDPPTYFEDLQEGYRRALAEQAATEAVPAGQAASPAKADPSGTTRGKARHEPHAGCGRLYVLAEKILAHDEQLPPEWPVCGTTGYEYLNQVGGLLIAEGGAAEMRAVYDRFIGHRVAFRDVLYDGKRTILDFSMSSELHVLAGMLDRIADRRRESRDFTSGLLRRALREVIAAFGVYRTYVRPGDDEVRADDGQRVISAIRQARRKNPELPRAVFDFLAGVLLLQDPPGLTDEQREERRRFVLKLQQVTGPVMAKGLEDTAFYRYYPLAAFNEVGGEPDSDGVPPADLHADFVRRAAEEPFALSSSTTHDTKRGEDVRARLAVLSELPQAWEQAVGRWRYLNAGLKTELDGVSAPDPNEAYLIYQTLVGTWPSGGWGDGGPTAEYADRIVAYCEKAFREAKVNTSWLDPNAEYEEATAAFVRGILDPAKSADFQADMAGFVREVADAGYTNSLSALLIKATSPGVPDIYQGCELWDFRLVDPDNRRPVDYARRSELLKTLADRADADADGLARELVAAWPDERIKFHVTRRALRFRRENRDLYLHGDYVPVETGGSRSNHVFAFARRRGDSWAVTVVPRLTAQADRDSPGRIAGSWWADTTVAIPPDAPGRWRNVLTGRVAHFEGDARAADLLADFPVGLWESA